MKRVLIRTHGGERIGLGHLMRCLSIAKGLKRYAKTVRFEVEWIVNREAIPLLEAEGFRAKAAERFSNQEEGLFEGEKPDAILFDAYGAGNPYLTFLKTRAKTLILIDDNNDQYASADVDAVINGNIHAPGLSYGDTFPRAERWVGPEFLAMKEEYWEMEDNDAPVPGNVLVTVGGADPLRLMEPLARALEPYPGQKTLIIGPAFGQPETERLTALFSRGYELVIAPRSLKPYILRAEVALTAAGSTIYEVLRLGRIPVLFELAENQRQIARVLEGAGIPNLGWHAQLTAERVFETVSQTVARRAQAYERCQPLFSLYDGQGVRRLVNAIETLLSETATGNANF